jgi:hypothetical protein
MINEVENAVSQEFVDWILSEYKQAVLESPVELDNRTDETKTNGLKTAIISDKGHKMRIRDELMNPNLPFASNKKSLLHIFPVLNLYSEGVGLPLHTHKNMVSIISIYLNGLEEDQGGKHHWIDLEGTDHFHTPKGRSLIHYSLPGGEESIVHGVTPMVYGESWRLQLFGVTGEFLKDPIGKWTSKYT